MRRPQGSARGISLIEAVVALAVVAFGMLAYVGIQSTLRLNSDVAKQRAEAVRIAQEAIEQWRAYTHIESDAGSTDYAEIATVGTESITGATTNTTYALDRTVVDSAGTPAEPRMKTLVVDVGWQDRNGDPQSVRLSTTIAAVPPELGGALSIPVAGGQLNPVQGRHPAIPVEAVDQENGTSLFQPPQPGDGPISWVFDNASGVITSICNPAPSDCSPFNGLLLSGFVRFATGDTQPTAADAESPPSASLAVEVVVDRTYPSALTVACFEQQRPTDVRYYCAVPVNGADDPPRWSGRSKLVGLALASSIADDSHGNYKVCRYTTERSHATVPPMSNADHPRDYANVRQALLQQNFLVIRAGADLDGSLEAPFVCPDDDPTTDFVNGRTWYHQPDS